MKWPINHRFKLIIGLSNGKSSFMRCCFSDKPRKITEIATESEKFSLSSKRQRQSDNKNETI